MGQPTRQQLIDDKKFAERESTRWADKFNGLDPEAKAFDACVKALKPLASSRSTYGTTPADESLRRVLKALAERFDTSLSEPLVQNMTIGTHPEPDVRDIIITQMIEALRDA